MRTERIRVVALLAVLACAAALAQQPAPADLSQSIDNAVQTFVAQQQIPAITVAVAVDGKVAYSKAFGTADLENAIKATPETLIRTGSIAKPISAVAAMTLFEAGKLDLDAPVQKYCAAFPQKQWAVTTRQLLGHVAGVRHYKDTEFESTRHFAKMSDGFAMFANDPLLFEPGTKYQYSTYGYTVVGCVIEGASGATFGDYVAQHVLQPAGMTHTFVDDVYAIVPHRARGYQKKDGKVQNAGLMDSSYKIPGGGFVSTAGDLVRFELALMEGKLLRPETVKLIWTNQTLRDGKPTNYGLGFAIVEPDGRKMIAHGGSQQGTSTAMSLAPDNKFAVAAMANMDGVNVGQLVRSITALYLKPAAAPATK